jgi:hypothetical protein
MSTKNNQGNGTLFSPEFREVLTRLKHKEPELDGIVAAATPNALCDLLSDLTQDDPDTQEDHND